MNKEKYEDVVNDEQFYQELVDIINKAINDGDISKEDWKKLNQKFNLLISCIHYRNRHCKKLLKSTIRGMDLVKILGRNVDDKYYSTIYECYDNLKTDVDGLSELKNIIDLIHKNKCYYILNFVYELLRTMFFKTDEIFKCIEDIKDASYNNTEYNHLSHVRYRRSHSYVTTIYEWIINELGYNQTKVKKR